MENIPKFIAANGRVDARKKNAGNKSEDCDSQDTSHGIVPRHLHQQQSSSNANAFEG